MQRWQFTSVAIALSGCISAGCSGDGQKHAGDGTVTDGDPTLDPGMRPVPVPTVHDFVSACISGVPELPLPVFNQPDEEAGTETGGSTGGDSDASEGALGTTSGATESDSDHETLGTSSGTSGASQEIAGTSSGTSSGATDSDWDHETLGTSDPGQETAGTSGGTSDASQETLGTSSGTSESGTHGATLAGANTDSPEPSGSTIGADPPPVVGGDIAWPLRETGHLVGVAIAAHRLRTPEYAAVAAQQFNYVTPENEMKWDAIERLPGEFDFRSADTIVEFARSHQMKVKGHTLVWHSQLPTWVEELQGPDAVRQAMTHHIEQTMLHFKNTYPGMVIAWDVVNEAIDSQNGVVSFRDSVFYEALGEGFIAEAFHLAHATDPDALLFYNDYGIESLNAKSQATYDMVRRMVESGVPIDGVGFQMHTAGFDWGPTQADFQQNLQRYIDLGLLVNISEMDVSLCFGFETPEQAWAAQRERVRQMVATCLQFEACDSITFWGVGDRDSWLNSFRPCENTEFEPWPLLFDDTYQPKPAWYGAYDAMTGCLAQP